MGIKKIQEFSTDYIQIMDETGDIDKQLMPKLSQKEIIKLYSYMVLTRLFDRRLLSLQRQGRTSTAVAVHGQEASQIGVAKAMKKTDWMVPSFRETGAYFYRGVPIEKIFLYYAGDERGNITTGNNLPISIPVASHMIHAVGIAMAMNIKGEKDKAVVTFFGDGATSEGEFHEAMNFAGVFNAPVVFICQNNQFAISTRPEQQTASKTLAQKAIAYGFEGVKVDGNDIFAVYYSAKKALEKARNGGGPTLIECLTYRLSDHTTADDSKKYRSEKELEEWKRKDPIPRLRTYMEKNGFWDKKKEGQLIASASKKIDLAVKKFEIIQEPDKKDMFSYLFEKMPKHLEEEYNMLIEK